MQTITLEPMTDETAFTLTEQGYAALMGMSSADFIARFGYDPCDPYHEDPCAEE